MLYYDGWTTQPGLFPQERVSFMDFGLDYRSTPGVA